MKTLPIKIILLILIANTFSPAVQSQSSVLINFGKSSCDEDMPPSFSLIKTPLSALTSLMASCSLEQQLPDIYSVFIAFNPRNNKIYIADIRTGATKIWILDVGLPGSIECPPFIPTEPTYTYNYVANNFEFDNNGDLWSLSAYDATKGQCNIDKFDVTTGKVINTRKLQFPKGHYPTAISSGDLCIAPNGRMFATLGIFPSQLYEIRNYNTSSTARASYIKKLPLPCYGIAYLESKLEITGFDQSGCYYYTYNIASKELGSISNFQQGQSPIDNSSFTPALGTTKQIVSSTFVNAATADIIYEVYVKNMGNVILNNVNVTDDLGKAFGAQNISDVSASFTPGSNAAGLVLNPAYNGTTVTTLLNPNQQLTNQNTTNADYFFKIQIHCRVSNINPVTTYYNSAIGTAIINNAIDPIHVADSSNNGTPDAIDPNNDGSPGGINENIPTPFNMAILPVHFLNINATLANHSFARINWSVATPVSNAAYFEVEFSTDGTAWNELSKLKMIDPHKSKYEFDHLNIPEGNLYYRIKQTDIDGKYIYSRIVLLQRNTPATTYHIYPNPANQSVSISTPYNTSGKTIIAWYDIQGRTIMSAAMKQTSIQINTANLPVGTYLLKMTNNNQTTTEKILIRR